MREAGGRRWAAGFCGSTRRAGAGLVDGKAPGKPPLLNAAQRRALAVIVEAAPVLAVQGVVRWRIADLAAWLQSTFAVTLSPQTLSQELRVLGYRKLSGRPRHPAQAEGAIADLGAISEKQEPVFGNRFNRPLKNSPFFPFYDSLG